MSEETPQKTAIRPLGWGLVVFRGVLVGSLTFGCLGLLLAVRLIEKPLFGQRRPVTPFITQFVCRSAIFLMGIRYRKIGQPLRGAGAIVANHSSWLDIFVLNAAQRLYFVSKAEVAKWPGIGWLARATGTIFITRARGKAASHIEIFRNRLSHGHRLLFFPEGTSTDGRRVLPFKPTLFEAFFDPHLRDNMAIQPVSVVYTAPNKQDPRLYGWWGDMDFAPHLLSTLAQFPQGNITVVYHTPVQVSDFKDRKTLAASLEKTVRDEVLARCS